MALATSSLPVPVSPWMRTAESVRATICTACQTLRSPCWEPIIALRAADESRGMMLIAFATMTFTPAGKGSTFNSVTECEILPGAQHPLAGQIDCNLRLEVVRTCMLLASMIAEYCSVPRYCTRARFPRSAHPDGLESPAILSVRLCKRLRRRLPIVQPSCVARPELRRSRLSNRNALSQVRDAP
jgi:hypothetical protein